MKFHNDTFYLELKDFPTENHSYVRKACHFYRNGLKKTWENINDPSDSRKCLIKFDSIPAKTLQEYGIIKEALIANQALNTIKTLISISTTDLDYYLNKPSTHNLASEYANIVAWMRLSASITRSQCSELGFKSVDEFYKRAIELMKKENFKTWKVDNLQVFKRRISPFYRALKGKLTHNEALDTVICAKFGHTNSTKLSQEQKDLLIQIYSAPQKPNFQQTYNLYLQRASEKVQEYLQTNGQKGWSQKAIVHMRTVENFLNAPENIQTWFAARHGYNEWRDKFDPIISRKGASFANAMWVMDGSPWHRYYRDGKNAYARLNIFPIIDAHSWAVIGFSVDYNENTEMVKRGLLGAVKRSGVLPYQLQYDHGPGNMSVYAQMCIDKLAKYNTPTQVGNARSKIIESFFAHFNDKILKFVPGYAGSNITAKKMDSRANREHLQALVKADAIPTLDEALAQMEIAFKIWNTTPFNGPLTPMEKYLKSFEETKEKQRFATEWNIIDAFWIMPGKIKQVKGIDSEGKTKSVSTFIPQLYNFTNNGITLQIDKQAYQFDVENADFRAYNIGKSFSVKYDPNEMKRMFLYDGDKPVCDTEGKILMAYEKTLLHMAVADREKGEGMEYHRLDQLKKQQYQLIKAKHAESIANTYVNDTHTPVTLGNMYPKAMENALKSTQMEGLIGDASLPDRNKKKPAVNNGTVFDITEEQPIMMEIPTKDNNESQPQSWWNY
jgi:hypothetical protein